MGHVFRWKIMKETVISEIIRKFKDRVTMDFNHPMAGKDVIFEGSVVALRKATPDDIPAN